MGDLIRHIWDIWWGDTFTILSRVMLSRLQQYYDCLNFVDMGPQTRSAGFGKSRVGFSGSAKPDIFDRPIRLLQDAAKRTSSRHWQKLFQGWFISRQEDKDDNSLHLSSSYAFNHNMVLLAVTFVISFFYLTFSWVWSRPSILYQPRLQVADHLALGFYLCWILPDPVIQPLSSGVDFHISIVPPAWRSLRQIVPLTTRGKRFPLRTGASTVRGMTNQPMLWLLMSCLGLLNLTVELWVKFFKFGWILSAKSPAYALSA